MPLVQAKVKFKAKTKVKAKVNVPPAATIKRVINLMYCILIG